MKEAFIHAAWEEGFPDEWSEHWFDIWALGKDEMAVKFDDFVKFLYEMEASRDVVRG